MTRNWALWVVRQVAGLAVLGALFGASYEVARILAERTR
jgi:hypothetical protein